MHLPAALIVALLCASPDPELVRLRPGSQLVLRVPGVNRVALADQDVADVHVVTNGELLLLGRHRGRTTLTLWVNGRHSTRSIVVDDGAGDDWARLIHDMVNPTLVVQTYEDKIIIDGVVDSMEELHRLQGLVAGDPRVKLLVRLDPVAIKVLAENITQAFHRNGLIEAHATAIGDRIVLEGSVTDPGEREKAQTIADSYYSGFAAR